jgi:hypothetical protein
MRAAYEGQISWLHAGRWLNGRPGGNRVPALLPYVTDNGAEVSGAGRRGLRWSCR